MNTSGGATLVAEPSIDAWDYGDFPYGLEPLALPPVGHAAVVSAGPYEVPDCDPVPALLNLRELAARGTHTEPDEDGEPTVDQLFWFRWITGHQVTFLIWRLMGGLLDQAAAGEPLNADLLARLETYADGYCAMLLYTGSCPREVYHSLIRPRMFLQHRSFSGTWSPDFTPVRGLFRGRGPMRSQAAEVAGLARAVQLHKVIHEGIAARLVPEGESLLQKAREEVTVRPSPRTALLYDNFFLTVRAEAGDRELVAQLMRRLLAVGLDLGRHGLYPMGPADEEWPEHLRTTAVLGCEARMNHLLYEIGEAAVRTTAVSARD